MNRERKLIRRQTRAGGLRVLLLNEAKALDCEGRHIEADRCRKAAGLMEDNSDNLKAATELLRSDNQAA